MGIIWERHWHPEFLYSDDYLVEEIYSNIEGKVIKEISTEKGVGLGRLLSVVVDVDKNYSSVYIPKRVTFLEVLVDRLFGGTSKIPILVHELNRTDFDGPFAIVTLSVRLTIEGPLVWIGESERLVYLNPWYMKDEALARMFVSKGPATHKWEKVLLFGINSKLLFVLSIAQCRKLHAKSLKDTTFDEVIQHARKLLGIPDLK